MTTLAEPASPLRRASLPTQHQGLLAAVLYRSCQLVGRLIWVLSIRTYVIGEEHLRVDGPLILASTHLSHLEPFLLSARLGRRIDWITRIEFFRLKWISRFLWTVGAFPVNRTGVPVSTVRIALDRLGSGRLVGICPEGGVAVGSKSACRGGFIRRGAGLLAYRTGAPVVPVVLLGTHTLNAVKPYLPFRRAKLWIAYGEPMYADQSLDRRASRDEFSQRLLDRYIALYQQLLQTFGLNDADVP